MRRRTFPALFAALTVGAAMVALGAPQAQAAAGLHYLDCSAGTNGDGSSTSPWNTVTGPTNHEFLPGDKLLIKRGTRCSGALGPKGSGTASAPVTIDAYGTGANPIIDGGQDKVNTAAVIIRDVSYWTITNLTITGGYWRGLWITGSTPNTTQRGFKLSNLDISYNGFHAGTGFGNWVSGTGGLVVEPCNVSTKFADVSIYNVRALNTHSVGIQIGHSEGLAYSPTEAVHSVNTPDCHMGIGMPPAVFPPKDGVSNVTIDHSESGSNEESGIWVAGSSGVLIQYSDLHDNGGVAKLNGEGAWWSNSYDVTAQYNKSYRNKRGNGDGGGFDADTHNERSLIQYNNVSDNDSYCVAAFGGAGSLTTEVTIRYNTCTNNGVNSKAAAEGDLFVWTAGQGTTTPSTIANYRAYSNTITRSTPGPVYRVDAKIDPSQPFYFSDNDVTHPVGTSTEPANNLLVDMIQAGPQIDHNHYWFTGGGTYASYRYGTLYTTQAGYLSGSGQDANSTFEPAP
jgi:hypothetical protein